MREASSTRQFCGVVLFIDLEILGSRLSFPNRSESNAPSFDELCYSISYTQSLLLAARNPDHYGCADQKNQVTARLLCQMRVYPSNRSMVNLCTYELICFVQTPMYD